uniref:SWIM-type domain-containing protein n=1 Tax=Myotis lucifugus TaxID=59463 RepID=G1PZU0_MYOLU
HEAGCPAFIIVKLSPLRDRLVVTECQLTHSHPACPIEFAYYFRPGRLLANTCLPVRTTNKISKQFLVLADVHRLLSYCKDRDHSVIDALRVLQGLFHKDPEAKVKLVFMENQAVVETVFFLTSRTRALLRRFPRLLLVDRLPGLQGALDLLAVLCVDGAGRARQAACCVARPGTPSLLRFALASLLQSAPDVKGRVRCLTAGPEVTAQLPAVRQLLRARACRSAARRAQSAGAGRRRREDPGLWPRLCRWWAPRRRAAYAEALVELRAHGPAAFVDYFERNWASRRDMWVRFRAFEAARDLDACALVRGHRRRLLRRLSPSRSMAQCLRDLVAMQWADASGEKEADWEPLAKFRAACGPELADLVAEELSFARQHGTRGFHVTGAGFALKDGTSDFFLDGALTRCSCSIHAARHLPCRHLFAARLLTGAALFHVDLL